MDYPALIIPATIWLTIVHILAVKGFLHFLHGD